LAHGKRRESAVSPRIALNKGAKKKCPKKKGVKESFAEENEPPARKTVSGRRWQKSERESEEEKKERGYSGISRRKGETRSKGIPREPDRGEKENRRGKKSLPYPSWREKRGSEREKPAKNEEPPRKRKGGGEQKLRGEEAPFRSTEKELKGKKA